MNEHFVESGKKGNHSMVARNFPSLHSSCSTEHIDINKVNGKSFIHELNRPIFTDLPSVLNFVRANIALLNKKSLKDIEDVINDELNLLSKTFKHLQ